MRRVLVLGCGRSYLDPADIWWHHVPDDVIKWGTNNFAISCRPVDWYHLEVKKHRSGPMWRKWAQNKHDFAGTTFLVNAERPYIQKLYMHDHWKRETYIARHRPEGDRTSGAYRFQPNHLSVSCASSMSLVLEFIVRMQQPDMIAFLGVDMNDSRYFWTDQTGTGQRFHRAGVPPMLNTCKPDERLPDDPHPTLPMADFIPEFCRVNGVRAVNLSVNGALADKMETYAPTVANSDKIWS